MSEQRRLIPADEQPDATVRATAAAVEVLLAEGLPTQGVIVPGLAAPGGSKKGIAVPTGGFLKSVHGHRRGAVAVADARGRLRFGRVTVSDANKHLKPWQRVVQANAIEQGTGELFDGSLAIVVRFERVRPPSHYRTGKSTSHLLRAGAPQRPTMAPDATKLLRGLEDALTDVLWADDALVVWQLTEKVYGSADQATITVVQLGPA